MRGRKPSCMACLVSEYAPEITACEAITEARVARITAGASQALGKSRKNGFSSAPGSRSSSAPWPM